MLQRHKKAQLVTPAITHAPQSLFNQRILVHHNSPNIKNASVRNTTKTLTFFLKQGTYFFKRRTVF